MAKMREDMPLEVDEARILFGEIKRLRSEGKAEAMRALEARLEAKGNHLKSLVTRLLASGIRIHEIVKSTGMSRQTITNYKKEYLELMGLSSLDEVEPLSEVEVRPLASIPAPIPSHITARADFYSIIIDKNDLHPADTKVKIESYGNIGRPTFGLPNYRPDWLTDELLRSLEHHLGFRIEGAPWHDTETE